MNPKPHRSLYEPPAEPAISPRLFWLLFGALLTLIFLIGALGAMLRLTP